MPDGTLVPYACLFDTLLGNLGSRKVFHMFRCWGRIQGIFGDMWQWSEDWWLWLKLGWNTAMAFRCCMSGATLLLHLKSLQNKIYSSRPGKKIFADLICLEVFFLCLERFPRGWLSSVTSSLLFLCRLQKPFPHIRRLFPVVQSYHSSSHALGQFSWWFPIVFASSHHSNLQVDRDPIYLFTAIPITLS